MPISLQLTGMVQLRKVVGGVPIAKCVFEGRIHVPILE